MIININSQTDLSGFYIVFEGSAQNETIGNRGISHLMEHLLCKNCEHLYDEFDLYGIENNAYTTDTDIVFFITGLDEYILKFREEFLNYITKFKITQEDLDKEKMIVIQEYMDLFNNQSQAHGENILRKLFNVYGPIGDKKDIESITLEDCKKWFDIQFSQPTKIINISKNNDFKKDIKFKTTINSNILCNKIPYKFEIINNFKGKASVINLSKLIISDFNVVDFICLMVGDGLRSPLYDELREKNGLCYYVQCFSRDINSNSSVVCIASSINKKNTKKFQKVIENVFSNKEKFLTIERFNIVKEQTLIKIKKDEIEVYKNEEYFIVDEFHRIDKNFIENLTFEKVNEIFDKYFKWEDFYKSIDNEEYKQYLNK